jgi:hypothetical protein
MDLTDLQPLKRLKLPAGRRKMRLVINDRRVMNVKLVGTGWGGRGPIWLIAPRHDGRKPRR